MPSGFMSATEFFQQVQDYFHYLFDNYGFTVATEETHGHADIAEVELDSSGWRVVIYREHAYVNIMVGPVQSESRVLYDLGHVIPFLNGNDETEAMWFGPEVKMSSDYVSRMHMQLRWWSEVLRENCDRLTDLFADDVFPAKQPQLVAWTNQVEEAIRRHLSGRNA
ncbi:MAG: hypothetical protein ACK2U9_20025 [Anaerolineae bacterium]